MCMDEDATVARLATACNIPPDAPYIKQVEQQQGSSAANEMEVERLKLENRKTMHVVQQWMKMYDNLHQRLKRELWVAGNVEVIQFGVGVVGTDNLNWSGSFKVEKLFDFEVNIVSYVCGA
ncbi:hypothetical protein ACOSQ2_016246 [Xanthoceras sorbifolium]